MKNPIYLNHDYRTRDGHTVHIIKARSFGELVPYCVTGDIIVDGGHELNMWTQTGCFDKDVRRHPYDLVKDITHA